MIYTIDHTTGSEEASLLQFSHTLPDELDVATSLVATANTCGGTVGGEESAAVSRLDFSGGTVAAGASCSVSVEVVTTTEGQPPAQSSALESSLGQSPPAFAVLDVAF